VHLGVATPETDGTEKARASVEINPAPEVVYTVATCDS
jgi:hypothetical protein